MKGVEVYYSVKVLNRSEISVRKLSKDMGFGEVAKKAVEKYRFKPGMQRDQPVPVESHIKINFKTMMR